MSIYLYIEYLFPGNTRFGSWQSKGGENALMKGTKSSILSCKSPTEMVITPIRKQRGSLKVHEGKLSCYKVVHVVVAQDNVHFLCFFRSRGLIDKENARSKSSCPISSVSVQCNVYPYI